MNPRHGVLAGAGYVDFDTESVELVVIAFFFFLPGYFLTGVFRRFLEGRHYAKTASVEAAHEKKLALLAEEEESGDQEDVDEEFTTSLGAQQQQKSAAR